MAKVSFQEAEIQDATHMVEGQPAAASPVDKGEVSKAVAVRENAAPAAYAPPASYTADDDAEGEFTSRDMRYPRLNVVQKTGELSDTFTPGQFVLSKEAVIGAHDDPLEVVVLQIQKRYQEDLPFGSPQIPRLFSTAAEVHEAGFSTEWGAKNRVNELLNMVLWISKGEKVQDDHVFTLEAPGGQLGTLAAFTVVKTSYGTVGKSIISARKTFCSPEKGGLVAMTWELFATLEKRNGNSWYLPRIRPLGPTKPELAQFLRDLKASA